MTENNAREQNPIKVADLLIAVVHASVLIMGWSVAAQIMRSILDDIGLWPDGAAFAAGLLNLEAWAVAVMGVTAAAVAAGLLWVRRCWSREKLLPICLLGLLVTVLPVLYFLERTHSVMWDL